MQFIRLGNLAEPIRSKIPRVESEKPEYRSSQKNFLET